MNEYALGIAYDVLNSAVGARILQDVIAVQNAISAWHRQLKVYAEKDKLSDLKKILKSMDIEFSNKKLDTPNIYLVYRVEQFPNVPPCIQVQRDFHQSQKSANIYLGLDFNGLPLKNEEHRMSYSNINRVYNHPNGFAPPDAAMIMMWGPVKASKKNKG